MEEGGVYSDDDDDDDSVTSVTDGDSAQGGSSPGPSSSTTATDENRNNTTAYGFLKTPPHGGRTVNQSPGRIKLEGAHLHGGHYLHQPFQPPPSSLFHIGPLPEASRDPRRPPPGAIPSSLATASPLVPSSMVLAAT